MSKPPNLHDYLVPFKESWSAMTKGQDGRIEELCGLIAKEQDRVKFQTLAKELTKALDDKEQSLKGHGEQPAGKPSSESQ